MPDIMMRLGDQVLVVDGALGTMLQRAGMSPGTCPELLNVTAPDMVGQIFDMYRFAGSDCVVTNSFGGTRPKLEEYGLGDRVAELNKAAVRLAREHGAPHILADVGPTGLVLEPLGPATFDEIFSAYAEQVEALASESPDAIIIETMTDIAEARCAVLAARSVTNLPIIVSVTFGASGRMDLSGTEPEAAAVILEASGATVVGLNCGLGPDQMLPLLKRMIAATTLPVIVQPNAGLPGLAPDGSTVFPGTPDEMGAFADAARRAGAAMIGSCCGSTPAFTAMIADAVGGKRVIEVPDRGYGTDVVLAGPRGVTSIGSNSDIRVIGERINPTGKKALKESLLAGSMSIVRQYAITQQNDGADLLDVNVGAAGVEATEALPAAVLALVGTADLPLVLDTTDVAALESALRIYPGRALINSVNGGTDSMDGVLPLAARYGAAVVILPLDDEGIPDTVQGRLKIVDRVLARAAEYGIEPSDVIVDGLVMTAATDRTAPQTTLGTVAALRERGLTTVLGLSNVSHGLPDRPLLNAAFFSAAVDAGLDAAIANPSDGLLVDAVRAANSVRHDSVGQASNAAAVWEDVLTAALERAAGPMAPASEKSGAPAHAAMSPAEELGEAVLRGDSDAAPALADAVIASGVSPEHVIGEVLTPAIQRLGDAYGRGEVFLPQLMVAADAMKAAVARVKEHLPEGADAGRGRVVFATVKGDIHSIGKDICVSLLESQGFVVDDLGVDVDAGRILAATDHADAVCLSALMTTTLPTMKATVDAVHGVDPRIPVFVGGAVVTREWADSVGAGYSADAVGCVEVVSEAVERAGHAR